ncbi:MAG: NHL repeat-containing protein [Planctomycetota bacterium]|nr:MAG: NHL repeat-containing protein [Planctomycetota bacterium]
MNWSLVIARWSLVVVALAVSLDLPAAEISTVAGTGKKEYSGDGGLAREAGAGEPYGLTIGPDGALYFCDIAFHVIRRVDKEGRISTVAGSGKKGFAGDGGPATKALLAEPYEIKFDADGSMYFVEMVNNLVRKVDRVGTISTVAGTGKSGFSGDGGPAREATFNKPHSIALDGKGSLFVCDIGNHRVRRVDLKTGIVTTFTGTGEKSVPKDGSSFLNAAVSGREQLISLRRAMRSSRSAKGTRSIDSTSRNNSSPIWREPGSKATREMAGQLGRRRCPVRKVLRSRRTETFFWPTPKATRSASCDTAAASSKPSQVTERSMTGRTAIRSPAAWLGLTESAWTRRVTSSSATARIIGFGN